MIAPHGNSLVKRRIPDSRVEEVKKDLKDNRTLSLDKELFLDFLNIVDGRYSPLKGFMSRNDFLKVVDDWTLEDGTIWPLPIVLDINSEEAEKIEPGEKLGLRNHEDNLVGFIEIDEIYRYNTEEVTEKIFGTSESGHPGVQQFKEKEPFLVGGDVKAFPEAGLKYERELTPHESRVLFREKEWDTVVGFQTRNVPHRAHEYLQKTALEHVDGLLIQPKMGRKKKGDYKDRAILAAYEKLISEYHVGPKVVLSVFPSRMLYGGPREAVFDAIVRKNQGCTHFIVGRDHAGVGDHYSDFAAQKVFNEIGDLGIKPIFYNYAFYCQKCDEIVSEKICPHSKEKHIEPSGTKIREIIESERNPPEEIMRPEVVEKLLELDEIFVGE